MISGTHKWYKHRKYTHFDTSLTVKQAEEIVTDPERVASHSFWPLIGYSTKDRVWRSREWRRKRRPLAYASHADSHIYSYYSHNLSLLYEQKLFTLGIGNVVLAYRTGLGKANYHHATEAFSTMLSADDVDVIGIDIKAYFDNIPHAALKRQWCELLGCDELPKDHYTVYKNCTKHAIVHMRQIRKATGMGKRRISKCSRIPLTPKEFRSKIVEAGLINVNSGGRGIPQGLPISGLLANLVLVDLDTKVVQMCAKLGGAYRRYSDDILLILPKDTSAKVEDKLSGLLQELGLEYQESKVARRRLIKDMHRWRCHELLRDGVVADEKPIQYLGFEFDGDQVLIRSQTQVRLDKRMRRAVRMARKSAKKHTPEGKMPKIRKRKLYEKFTHLRAHKETPKDRRARGSFYSYASRAEVVFSNDDIMKRFQVSIRRQLRRQWSRLNRMIDEANKELHEEWVSHNK